MKKEYKVLLYAYPFIIVIFILATVGVPLFAFVDVAFLVLYYYILQKSFSKINTIKNADEYAAFTNANADQRVQDAKAAAEKMRKETEDSCAQKIQNADQCVQDAKAAAEKMRKEAEDSCTQKIQAVERELTQKRKCISQLNIEIHNLKAEIEVAQQEAVAVSSSVPVDYDISSAEYKDKFALAQLNEKECISSNNAVSVYSDAPKSVVNANVKQILRCFNSEAAAIIKNVTTRNIDGARSKIIKSFEMLNRIFAPDGVELNRPLLEIKLEQLNCMYGNQVMAEREKEEQRAIREQMLEEEKVRREIEREKAKLDKEERQFKNEIQKLMTYLHKADDIEKQLYVDKIKELEAKLGLLEQDRKNVLDREQNTRAGFVYVISNIGSFGENVYKIGMTRRLEPMDRIKELSSASVPFEFDVHAMIFSEDAPALETALHRQFDDRRINLVNSRKEFFRVSLSEVEKVVKENHNATVTFTAVAKAEEYRQTVRLLESEQV